MSELYLIFFAVGILIFGAIVGFSVYQQRRQNSGVSDKLGRKSKKSPLSKTHSAKKRSKSKQSASQEKAAPLMPNNSDSFEPSGAEELLNKESEEPIEEFIEESIEDTSSESTLNEHILDSSVNSQLAKPSANQESSKKQEPTLDDSQSAAASATVHKAELAPKPQMEKDSSTVVTELVARVKNPEPIEQQQLLSIFRKHDFKFHRKAHIYGLNQLTDMWRDIEFELPSARFLELGISIQLADREGAMSQKELHDFQQMVLEFSNVFDAPFEFSMDIDDALKQSLALDQIGRRYDSMAVLNVVPKSKTGFRMADIESCARDLMMSTDKNGIFMKTSGQKNNITIHFRLACTDDSGQFGISSGSSKPVHDLVVYMNVPATKDPELVFQDMVKDANSLATWLEGKVVDRHGRHMTQRSYSTLMQQVSDIAFSMQQDGFTPGDAVAKKLF